MEKTDFRKLTISERYQFRKRAVTLVKSGKKQKEVSISIRKQCELLSITSP